MQDSYTETKKEVNVQMSQPKIFSSVNAAWRYSNDYISDSCIPFLQILWLTYNLAPSTGNGKNTVVIDGLKLSL